MQRTLLLKWSGCLAANLLFAILWTKSGTGSAGSKIRKVFHFGITAVFVLGVKEDMELLAFCSACLLLILIVLEVSVRCYRLRS